MCLYAFCLAIPEMTYTVSGGTLNATHSLTIEVFIVIMHSWQLGLNLVVFRQWTTSVCCNCWSVISEHCRLCDVNDSCARGTCDTSTRSYCPSVFCVCVFFMT